MLKKIIVVGSVIVMSSIHLNAQNFGFGCLGLSGVFGGYSMQQFNTDGIQKNIVDFYLSNGLQTPDIDLKQLEGYRIGANIFRAKFSNFFLTTKGYYQFLGKTQAVFSDGMSQYKNDEITLSLNHWGVGFDLGCPIFSFLDWKILEGGVNFYDLDLDYQPTAESNLRDKIHYSTDEVKIGYYAGTGIIIHIVPNYLSIEGTAIYNFISINDSMSQDDDIFNLSNNENELIKGEFGGVVQINLGFPL